MNCLLRALSLFLIMLAIPFAQSLAKEGGGTGVGNGGGGGARMYEKYLGSRTARGAADRGSGGGFTVYKYPPEQRETSSDGLIDRGIRMLRCPERRGMRVPELSEKIAHLVLIQDEMGKPLTHAEACRSDAIFHAYRVLLGNFRILEDQPYALTLLEEIHARGGAIPIRIHSKGQVLSRIEETMWFDPTFGGVAWAHSRYDNSLGYLVHELGHVLTFRIFGGYPAIRNWHDLRGIHVGDGNALEIDESQLLSMRTAPEAAFFESVSNALASPFSSHVFDHISTSSGPAFESSFQCPGGNECANSTLELTMSRREAALRVSCSPRLLQNEAFLTSGLHILANRWIDSLDPKEAEREALKELFPFNPKYGSKVMNFPVQERLAFFVKALVRAKSMDVLDVLAEFDRIRGGNLGAHIARSHFLRDLDTRACIARKLDRIERRDENGRKVVALRTNSKLPSSYFTELTREIESTQQANEALRAPVTRKYARKEVILKEIHWLERKTGEALVRLREAKQALAPRLQKIDRWLRNHPERDAIVEAIYMRGSCGTPDLTRRPIANEILKQMPDPSVVDYVHEFLASERDAIIRDILKMPGFLEQSIDSLEVQVPYYSKGAGMSLETAEGFLKCIDELEAWADGGWTRGE